MIKTFPIINMDPKTFEVNHKLVERIPAELACRYHALPIATDGTRITVAMADPGDVIASTAITDALGSPACIVQADKNAIDSLLAEFFPEMAAIQTRILTWAPNPRRAEKVLPFAQNIAALLNAEMVNHTAQQQGVSVYHSLAEEVEQQPTELLIFDSPDAPLLKRLLIDRAEDRLIHHSAVPILVARNPRWPIRKILLALHDIETNQSAINWAIRLGHLCQARLTILPLVLNPPGLYGPAIQIHLPDLLSSGCVLGQQLRDIAQRLAAWDIQGVFRVRQEVPELQIRAELNDDVDGQYDLIIIAIEKHHWQWRWIIGELVNPLLNWADLPVLITKPSQ